MICSVLARSPEGELGSAMRFIGRSGKLSLDTMRRVGQTPKSMTDAVVVPGRSRWLANAASPRSAATSRASRTCCAGQPGRQSPGSRPHGRHTATGRHFQMERLVRFNDKFSAGRRPRYLVYETRAGLPRTVVHLCRPRATCQSRERPQLPGRGGLAASRGGQAGRAQTARASESCGGPATCGA